MWGRARNRPAVEEPPDLDTQIAGLRAVIAGGGASAAVGPLIALLTARATLAVTAGRNDDALEDRRAAAGLIRGYEGQGPPVDRDTDLLVRMGLVASERQAGHLDEASAAVPWALAAVQDVGEDDLRICAAFLVDLDRLRADLRSAGRRLESLSVAADASDLATRLAQRDEATYVPVLGTMWVNEASARANAGDLQGARALNDEAIALLEELAPDAPALPTALANRAHLHRSSGEWADAVVTEQRLLADVRESSPATMAEVERLNRLFLTLVRAGRPQEAEQTICDAVAVARRLAAVDPEREAVVATLLGNLANVRGELHRYDDALTVSQEALCIRERLAATRPSPDADKGLAMILNNHSAVLRRVGRIEEAAESAARSVDVRRRLAAQDGEPNRLALLANSLNTHAEQLAHLGDGDRAVGRAEEAHEIYAALPPPGAAPKFLRANQDTLGRALAVAGRYDEAVAAATRAVELGRVAAEQTPGELPELASCLDSLAERLLQVGRETDAESARAEATRVRAAAS